MRLRARGLGHELQALLAPATDQERRAHADKRVRSRVGGPRREERVSDAADSAADHGSNEEAGSEDAARVARGI